ncbi:hypothetical protein D910_11748 [Dendroctonus ponderosae]
MRRGYVSLINIIDQIKCNSVVKTQVFPRARSPARITPNIFAQSLCSEPVRLKVCDVLRSQDIHHWTDKGGR